LRDGAGRPGRLAAASLALAAVSLLLPWALAFDPWSWLVWGREVTRLELDTAGGPSWKPLPVVATTILTLAGGAAPALCWRSRAPRRSRAGSPGPSRRWRPLRRWR
jgi:hypothetical protein